MIRRVPPIAIFVAVVACGGQPGPSAEPEAAKPAEHAGGHHVPGDGHHVHHRFDDAKRWAKEFDDPERDQWQKPDEVIAALALAPDARIVDLGAGTGYFAVRLAKAVPKGEVLANDIEPDMVRHLGERARNEGLANLRPVKGEANDPKIDGEVDLAFMCNVYHHIEDRPAFFAHVLRGLRPGGRLAIVDFRKDAPADIPGPPPKMRIAQTRVVTELTEVGFRLVKADRALMPYHYLLIFER